MERKFICPTCGATKTIKQRDGMSRAEFFNRLPAVVFCGWRGCKDYAIPEEEYNAKKGA